MNLPYERAESLIVAYKAGRRDFVHADLAGTNLDEANLAEANFTTADLSGATLNFTVLVGAKLTGAKLAGAKLAGANLTGADLREACVGDADLDEANLTHAQLGGVDLSRANLSGANLSGANLSGANFSSWAHGSAVNLSGANLCDADLTDANLCGQDLRDVNLTGANLTRANLRHVKLPEALVGVAFTGTNLSGRDLTGANLTRANLVGANLTRVGLTAVDLTAVDLTDADLTSADLTSANFTHTKLAGANLTGADLREACLVDANLTHARLVGADLHEANLHRANLSGANLHRADLSGAKLRGANFCDADLTDTNLSGQDLRGVNLTGANLTGANLREESLPEGLRSVNAGADLSEILDPQRVVGKFSFSTYDRYPGGNADMWQVSVTLVTKPGSEPSLQAMAHQNWDGSYYIYQRGNVPLGPLTEKVKKVVELGQALIDSGQSIIERYICDERYDDQEEDTEWTCLDFRLFAELEACADHSYALRVIRSAVDRADWVEGDPSIPRPDERAQAFIDAVFDLTGIGRVMDFAQRRDAFWTAVGEWQSQRKRVEPLLPDWLEEAGQREAERPRAPVNIGHRKLRWESLEMQVHVSDLSACELRQVARHGALCDGRELSAEQRLVDPTYSFPTDDEEGAGVGPRITTSLERAVVLEDDDTPLLDVWISDKDYSFFRSGTTECVARGKQHRWFACADLTIWEAIGDLDKKHSEVTLSVFLVTPECYDSLATRPADHRRLLGRADVDLGTAWRPLLLVTAPWDPDRTVARVLTASAAGVIPNLHLDRGVQPAYFAADQLAAINKVLSRIPADAARQRIEALRAAYPRAVLPQTRVLDALLADLRAAISQASDSGAGLLVAVSALWSTSRHLCWSGLPVGSDEIDEILLRYGIATREPDGQRR